MRAKYTFDPRQVIEYLQIRNESHSATQEILAHLSDLAKDQTLLENMMRSGHKVLGSNGAYFLQDFFKPTSIHPTYFWTNDASSLPAELRHYSGRNVEQHEIIEWLVSDNGDCFVYSYPIWDNVVRELVVRREMFKRGDEINRKVSEDDKRMLAQDGSLFHLKDLGKRFAFKLSPEDLSRKPLWRPETDIDEDIIGRIKV